MLIGQLVKLCCLKSLYCSNSTQLVITNLITISLTRSLEARLGERKDSYSDRKDQYGSQKEQYSISEFLTKMAQGEQVDLAKTHF